MNIIISFFFLAKLKEGIHEKYDFRFKDIFRNISLGAFLANISIEGNLRKRVFPIYLTLIFVSLETPIVIASAAGLVSILLNHVAAHFKSRNQNGLIYVTIFLKLIFWVAISLGISHA